MIANNRQRTQPLRVRLLFISIIISWVIRPPHLFLIGCTVVVVSALWTGWLCKCKQGFEGGAGDIDLYE